MARDVIFVSHCSKDKPFSELIFKHLRSLETLLDMEVWTDVDDIRAGDEWGDRIAQALRQARAAVILISPDFLTSEFIRTHEVPELLRRRDLTGLRIIPLHMKPGAWPEWITRTEMRPKGEKSLFEISEGSPAAFEKEMARIIDEIRGLMRAGPDASSPSVKLLCASLLRDMHEPADFARHLAGEVARVTGLAADGLFDATRLFIEYQLLEAADAGNHAALGIPPARRGEPPDALRELLQQFGRTGSAKDLTHEVLSEFFNRTLEREAAWQRYFEAVAEHGGEQKTTIASLLRIHVRMGYVAAQSLVAGLLARFDNEWRPVLDAYQSSVPRPNDRLSAFESLQASQWNCWLMWGPSVPLCTCDQWRGVFAFQYGYGDENNSLPVLELGPDAGLPPRLGALGGQLRAERRGAKLSELRARLRPGPWFLEEYAEPRAQDEFSLADQNRRRRRAGLAKYPVAPAQAALYRTGGGAGLVLQLDEAEAPRPQQETRVYFSAYYWMIFLVATPPAPGEAGKDGPALLRGKHYPDWDSRADGIVRDRLWQDLLPVFVHANVGDPAAFRFQRQVLVQNALQMLRDVWSRREELFHADDVEAGIRFYLACASDYSGCGCPIRYAPEDTLVEALRASLAAEPDAGFAGAVQLPVGDETPAGRAPGLAGYFSSCHLPEMIAGYYRHVAQISGPEQ